MLTKRIPLLTILFLSLSSVLIGQHTLKGKVTDSKQKPLGYATVALYDGPQLIDGVITEDDGNFTFSDVNKGTYTLEVNLLSYENYKLENVSVPGGELNIVLVEDVNELDVVEVKAKLPLLEQKSDRLVVNVENNITNNNSNILDVMKKVPGVLVINDRMTLAGSGQPTILINGKSTQYVDIQSLLKNMPGDNIKKVEIIYQPGAEYEASGTGPIVNIILKKNSLFGTNGSVFIGVGRHELWKYNAGINVSHFQGPLNITAGAGISRNSWIEELNLTRRLTDIDPTVNGVYGQVNKEEALPFSYRGNLRVDYDITDQHRLGVEAKTYSNESIFTGVNTTDVDLAMEELQDFTLITTNDHDNNWSYRNINPYYIFEIDTAGQKLELDVNFARYKVKRNSYLTTTSDINTESSESKFDQPGLNKIFGAALDYTKPLNSNMDLKLGVKYSEASLDNEIISLYKDNGEWINNTGQSNHYLFDESIKAAYAKYSWKWSKWSGTAGVRYEESISEGRSLTIDSTLDRTIKKFFPSASISRELGDLTASVAYSYRIDRPRYSSLNPFLYFIDPFTFGKGNPNLRPELTHSTKFSLSYQGQPFFNIEYKNTSHSIVEVTEQSENSESAFKTDVNLDDHKLFSSSLFFPLSFIPKLSGYGGIIATYTDYNSAYLEETFSAKQWNYTAVLQVEFKLPFDINGQIGGWYTSNNQEGIFKSEYLYGTSFGLSKKFLNDKLKVSLGVEDFVNRFYHANVDYQQDMDVVSKWQAPIVNMNVRYRFGNQHLKGKSKLKNSAGEELKRAQQ